MLWGGSLGGLEIRKEGGAVRLAGRFPYNAPAVLSDGGRTGKPREEVIASRAFGYRIDTPSGHGGKKDIHLLSGHDFGKPIASVRSETLDLTDDDDGVSFTATISEEMQQVSYVRDVLAAIGSGLAVGISPGFRIPPRRVVANPEAFEEGDTIKRTVKSALLYEFSIVTRPAYPLAQIEARSWEFCPKLEKTRTYQGVTRWR